ncbi:transporter substrate-binding domain-containing protein [Rhizobium lusitanum]|uniref:Transporter substrate-binding domain-containing protein n=1 Tax=Rhizobium lusitanum TaxID=293958 RepID=A0A6L9UES0_9HYPH|nr:ABC transporter substrate-binding protein [Rhizobium lusitanum]NEI73881.1 transporter substrate-binding domain-containing protein [Rhizobium lusitanum]
MSASAQSAADLSTVTVTIGTPNKTGLHRQLIAAGEVENVPYKIKWADFDSTPPLVEALRAGHVDIAAGGDTGVLSAIANGVKVTILAATWERKESGSAILVRGDSDLGKVADLKGRKVALPYFTKQHYQFAKALEQAGVPWDPKLILNLNTTDGLSALVNGQVDAFVVWDPNTAIAQQQHGARILQSLSKVIDTAGVLYAPTSSLADPARKAALEDLTRRIIRAQAWVNAHPQEWSAQVAKLSQISPDAANLQTSRSFQEYAPATDANALKGWQQEVAYFHQSGQFKNEFQVENYVAKDFDDVINSENKKLAKKN